MPIEIQPKSFNVTAMANNGVGDRVRHLRKKAGLSQNDLAVALKINPTTVSRWERGQYEPTQDILERLAKALASSVVYITDGTDMDAGIFANPRYVAWAEFIFSDAGRSMAPQEQALLASARWPEGEPGVPHYEWMLRELRRMKVLDEWNEWVSDYTKINRVIRP